NTCFSRSSCTWWSQSIARRETWDARALSLQSRARQAIKTVTMILADQATMTGQDGQVTNEQPGRPKRTTTHET
ncbi:hypothetical protein AB0O34_35335, partial [Sphaerisporangium sp. NPDC088356]|uniref:hypothetical protein n=1 Tax=Sphaerisporangium sp. NPDC088356 TaxID=3154871 RepID=UPI00342DDD32